MNTQMLEEMLGHLAARARGRRGPRPGPLLDRPHGPLGRRRRPRGARRRRPCPPDGAVRQPLRRAHGLPEPTVAACHGSCVGGGAEIAVACDLRVGGSNLRLRFPGGALGVPVGPARLVTLCGLSVAKYLLLTGKEVSADEALRWGLVHRVAPAASTEEEALELAAAVAEHPPEAVARPEAHAPRVGRRRGALAGRGRGPGGVAALRARAFRTRPSALEPFGAVERAVDPAIGGETCRSSAAGCRMAPGTEGRLRRILVPAAHSGRRLGRASDPVLCRAHISHEQASKDPRPMNKPFHALRARFRARPCL